MTFSDPAEPCVVSLKQFMLTEQKCPAAWHAYDLYLFRDDDCVFYVGQSDRAFYRVWDHILGGFKGRSVIGRFILCNWPRSMKFTIELHHSASERFAPVGHDCVAPEDVRDAAERALIEQYTPCFNVSLNAAPRDLPACYRPTTAKPLCSRSLRKLIMEANLALQADQRRQYLTGDS